MVPMILPVVSEIFIELLCELCVHLNGGSNSEINVLRMDRYYFSGELLQGRPGEQDMLPVRPPFSYGESGKIMNIRIIRNPDISYLCYTPSLGSGILPSFTLGRIAG